MDAFNPENLYGDRLFTSLERNQPGPGSLLIAALGWRRRSLPVL